MSINFSPNRWDSIRRTYDQWWSRTLDRPLIPVILEGVDPKRPCPNIPLLSQATCDDLSIPVEALIDRMDYELSKFEYLGDAFPFMNLDSFGPGVMAAFIGAKLDNSTSRVWFHPEKILPIKELHFEYDPDNQWLLRVKSLCRAAMKRWQGQVLVGMPDLGGVLDVLSIFRPSEQMLFDLYDYPEEVKRLIWELHELWFRYYEEINSVLQPINPGYSDWSKIYSSTPSYVPQCDFSYMISPNMFDEFVLPELKAACSRLDHTIYHLDGVGELSHLDSILSIDALDAVQWVPGDGKPDHSHWPDLYPRFHQAGKNTQVWYGFECLDTVASQIGTYCGIHHTPIHMAIDQEKVVRKKLEQYGIV